MDDSNPHLTRWVLDERQERQETSSHEVYAIGLGGPGGPLEGAGGIAIHSSDNAIGRRLLELDVRPVLLGQAEVRVRLTTHAPKSKRPHSKHAYLYASPTALREFARQLLETADAADKLRLKPKPVR